MNNDVFLYRVEKMGDSYRVPKENPVSVHEWTRRPNPVIECTPGTLTVYVWAKHYHDAFLTALQLFDRYTPKTILDEKGEG